MEQSISSELMGALFSKEMNKIYKKSVLFTKDASLLHQSSENV